MHFTNIFRNDLTNAVLKMSVTVLSSTYFTEGRFPVGEGGAEEGNSNISIHT